MNSIIRTQGLDKQIEQLFECKLLGEEEVIQICNMSKDYFQNMGNIVKLQSPITVCGDIHGQFYDLMELFKITGAPPEVNMLFLGDYVDWGYFSIECVCLLLCLQLKYPQNVTLLRGNHESSTITQTYGFYDECLMKYGNINVWKSLTDLFNFLPLVAVIDQELFCLHGGLSPQSLTFDEIQRINWFSEVPQQGAMCDLLWSDPGETMGFQTSARGAGFLFGQDVSDDFLKKNGLKQIIRAHQLVEEGYQTAHDQKVLTVFSAPNYCYRCSNLAAIVHIDEYWQQECVQFQQAERRGDIQIGMRSKEYFMID